jgi:hypothetical protein
MRERGRVGATGSSAGSRGDERTTTRRDATRRKKTARLGRFPPNDHPVDEARD